MQKILVLGGTRFLGRNIVERLVTKPTKYEITLFNRGKSEPHLFKQAKRIVGDRETADVDKITEHNWDVIIDVNGYFPDSLNHLLNRLQGKVGRYVYVSTCGAMQFDKNTNTPLTENAPLRLCSGAQKMDKTGASYNENKAECERVLLSKTWLNKIILRPALVIGQYDYTDRLYYWFYKMQKQHQILVANNAAQLLAYSDVRDFAVLMEQAITVKANFEVYNAISYNTSIGSFIEFMKSELTEDKEIISASTEFLLKHEVAEWSGLPLWLDGNYFTANNSRLLQDFEFTAKTVEKSTQHLLDYYGNHLKWRPYNLPKAITAEREKKLIQLLRKL